MLSIWELLAVLAPVYHNRVRSGYSRFDAAQFGSYEDIHRDYFTSYSPCAVDAACRELGRLDLADVLYKDGHAYRVELRRKAVTQRRAKTREAEQEVVQEVVQEVAQKTGQDARPKGRCTQHAQHSYFVYTSSTL